MQRVLGEDWAALPAAIQRHYRITEPQQAIVVSGNMAIDYPRRLTAVLKLLRLLSALVHLKGGQDGGSGKKMATNRPVDAVLAAAHSSSQRQAMPIRFTHGLATGS